MKNNTYKKFSTLASILILLHTLLTLTFDFIYRCFLILAYNAFFNTYLVIIPIIFTLIASVLLIIGVVKKNKIIIVISFAISIFISLFDIIRFIICCDNQITTFLGYLLVGLPCLCYLLFYLCLMFFILTLFKMSESTNETNVNKPQINSVKTVSPDITNTLLEYKDLLDIGAITQEEFESKKRELLNL